MNRFAVLFVLYVLSAGVLLGEGTRELAPNDSIDINGNTTTDIAALNLDHPEYNNFASYDNPNPQNRLHINIQDPGAECIFLGFSAGELNGGMHVDFEFRIKDPNGNIVYGPVLVDASNANTPTWEEAYNGPVSVAGPSGYIPFVVTSADLSSQGNNTSGDYYIEFRNTSGSEGFLIRYWDVTVANCASPGIQERKGRLWSNNWALFALNDFGFPERPFNGSFYICAPDPANAAAAFITRVDFNGSGFRPAGFNIAFNSFGVQQTGDITIDRMSVEDGNLTSPEYEIFLNDPVDLCQTAAQGDIDLLAITRCSSTDICINFITTRAGQLDVLLDFDGQDGQFTPGTADRLIAQMIPPGQVNKTTCLNWDGLDGLGNNVSNMPDARIPIIMSYAQGIYHFPIYDAELLTNGLNIQRVRPNGSNPLLYYDDSNISTPNGTGDPMIQLTGCNAPCHKWTTYTGPRDLGFGNLNTINTWWFSQQVVTEAVLTLPGYPECTTAAVDSICPGDSAMISADFNILPTGSQDINVTDLFWTGPNIISDPTQRTIDVIGSGDYVLEYRWSTYPGDTCSRTCSVTIAEGGTKEYRIDTLIQSGDTILLYGEEYFEEGEYRQKRNAQTGCDSLIIINVSIQEAVIRYDLEDCRSLPWDGSNQSYDEFQPDYLRSLDCAEMTASILFRENPQVNMHSCSYGINGSTAMCVGSLDTCAYLPGNDKSIVFEVTVNPIQDTAVALTGISFWERAPEMFRWIRGDSGDNNYPTLYGVRVLKNDSVIYEVSGLPTTENWTEEIFTFDSIPEFTATGFSTYRFELLPYCLVGNGAIMDAWDIDEVLIFANCDASTTITRPQISGLVLDVNEQVIEGAQIDIRAIGNSGYTANALTNSQGEYLLPHNPDNEKLEMQAQYDDDPINGVSVRDILSILQHLRGRKVITDPVVMIAADVNKSQSISIGDAAEISRVLLDKQPQFENKPSWEVGISRESIIPDDPWSFYDPRYILLSGEDRMSENWLAIKTGDVDLSVISHSNRNVTRGRDVVFTIDDMWIEKGQTFNVHLVSTEDIELNGLQLALDLSEVNLIGASSRHLDLSTSSFLNSQGEYSLAWCSLDALRLERGQSILEFTLTAEKSGRTSDLISIKSDRIEASAIGSDDATSRVHLSFEAPYSIDEGDILVRTVPNPFSEQLTFIFNPEVSGEVTIDLVDLDGRVCYNTQHVIDGGGSVTINSDEIGCPPTALIFRITSKNHHMVGKVIKK